MSTFFTRRGLLASAAAMTAARLLHPSLAMAAPAPALLTAARRTIEVNGRPASVFSLTSGNGAAGVALDEGQRFALTLDNRAGEPTIVHWHGQTPPPDQDGVTDTGYAQPVADGTTQVYDFVARPGTHWMHSHHGLQEQNLFAAPLIVRSREDVSADHQEVVVLLHDFSFRTPEEILAGLTGSGGQAMAGMAGHDMAGHGMMGADMPAHDMAGMGAGMMAGMDLNDVEYDAYLANDRTLDDPEVVRTEAGRQGPAADHQRRHAPPPSGSTSAALGHAGRGRRQSGRAWSRGRPSRSPRASGSTSWSRFPPAVSCRSWRPTRGRPAAYRHRPGGARRVGVADRRRGAEPAGPVDLSLEAPPRRDCTARCPRGRQIVHRIALTGAMMPYAWAIDGRTSAGPVTLQGPVRRTRSDPSREPVDDGAPDAPSRPSFPGGCASTAMALAGAVRDTVLVPPMSSVAVAFDADNPGRWLFHCHNLYHMATGMMAEIAYEGA